MLFLMWGIAARWKKEKSCCCTMHKTVCIRLGRPLEWSVMVDIDSVFFCDERWGWMMVFYVHHLIWLAQTAPVLSPCLWLVYVCDKFVVWDEGVVNRRFGELRWTSVKSRGFVTKNTTCWPESVEGCPGSRRRVNCLLGQVRKLLEWVAFELRRVLL